MSKTTSIIIFVITLILLVGGLFLATRTPPQSIETAKLDQFAQCLTDKGMVMYGAYWCQHCKNVKEKFGSSFSKINYVECTIETKTCTEKAINSYPTFIWSDGSRSEGELTFGQFAEKSGCELPEKSTD